MHKQSVEIWVLTKSVNEYSPHGEYFVHAWPYKPGIRELQKVLGTLFTDYAKWLLETGGGRQNAEEEWFYLSTFENWLKRNTVNPQLKLF
jgi:hypothetical protein